MTNKLKKYTILAVTAVILLCSFSTSEASYYDSSTAIVSNSAVTAAELDQTLAGTGLAGLGQDFVDAERLHGVNAVFLAALAAHESAWGESDLAQTKNNLFGYGAYDDDPDNAFAYASPRECILAVAAALAEDYGSPDGCFYVDGTIAGVNSVYASSQSWSTAITGAMMAIDPR